MSWIIQLRNGFEVKGHLQEEMVCCGCHHLGKGPFRGAGEAGGCAVDFPVVDCLLLNSTVQTPRTHCFLLWEGGGAWAGDAQEVSAPSGAGGHPAGVYGECGDVWVPQRPGTPQEWNCLSPCDGGASSRSPRRCWGERQYCGVGSARWALQPLPSTARVAPRCSVPTIVLLAKDFPKLHLVSTSRFSVCLGRRLARGGFSYCAWQGGW